MKRKTEVKTKEPAAAVAGNGHGTNGAPAGPEFKIVPHESVRPDPLQPRTQFDQVKLESLAESIRQVGIQQPLKVRAGETARCSVAFDLEPNFILIDGERRWRAAKLAGLEKVPVLVEDIEERKRFAVQYVLNQQHENLTALEEATAFQAQLKAEEGLTVDELAKRLGISRSTAFGRLALMRLHEPVRQALVAGKISTSVAGLVAMVPEPKQQEKLLKTITDEGSWQFPYSFKDVQELIDDDYIRQLDKAQFNREKIYNGNIPGRAGDAKHLGAMGTCGSCPRRSGNMTEQFPDLVKRPNVCTDPGCFDAKANVHQDEKLEAAKEKGETVLPASETKKLFPSWSPTELSHGCGYARLTDCCYQDPKRRTFQQLLKKEAPPALAVLNGSGQLTHVYKESELKKALQAKGYDFAQAEQKDAVKRKETQLQVERREKLGPALMRELVEKLEALPTDSKAELEFWRFIIGWMNEDQFDGAARRRGLKGSADKATKGMSLKEVRGLAVEMVLHNCYGDGVALVESYSGEWREEFKQAADLAGMDLKASEKKLEEPELKDMPQKETKAKKK